MKQRLISTAICVSPLKILSFVSYYPKDGNSGTHSPLPRADRRGQMKKKPAKKRALPKRADAKPPALTDEVLTGWPKIAAYLGQPVSVAQRWHSPSAFFIASL